MTLKRKLTWVLLLVVSVILTACGGSDEPSSSNNSEETSGETIKIGAIWDVTGGASSMGVPERNAFNLLVEQTNEEGGINGKKLEVIEADNQSDETKALTEAKRMINQENVLAIVGASQSTTSLAIVPVAQQAGVPYIANGSARKIIDGNEWVFTTPPSDEALIRSLLVNMQEKGIKKIAMLRVNNDFGMSGEAAFKKLAPEYGLELLGIEQFNADIKDAKVQINNVMKDEPEALIVWGLVPATATVARDLNDLGHKDKIEMYAASGAVSQQLVELAGSASEGIIMPTYKLLVADSLDDSDSQAKLVKEFKAAYEAKYDDKLSQFPSNAADAFILLKNAIEQAGENLDRQTIRDNLEATTGLMGQIGEYNMTPEDHNGLDGSGLITVQIKNGEFVLYE